MALVGFSQAHLEPSRLQSPTSALKMQDNQIRSRAASLLIYLGGCQNYGPLVGYPEY